MIIDTSNEVVKVGTDVGRRLMVVLRTFPIQTVPKLLRQTCWVIEWVGRRMD